MFVDGFSIYSTIDEWSTLGKIVGFAVDKQAAETCAKGQGWYGGTGRIKTCKFLVIQGEYFSLQSDGPVPMYTAGQSLRAQALSKLTPEERAELGL